MTVDRVLPCILINIDLYYFIDKHLLYSVAILTSFSIITIEILIERLARFSFVFILNVLSFVSKFVFTVCKRASVLVVAVLIENPVFA